MPTTGTAMSTAVEECHRERLGNENTALSGLPPVPFDAAIRRVVIPLEGTTVSEHALQVGIVLARACNAEILLVRCYSERASLPSGSTALLATGGIAGSVASHEDVRRPAQPGGQHPLQAALAYLERTRKTIAQPGRVVHTAAVQWPPSYAIVQLANRPLDDLVVMTTHLGAEGVPQPSSASITREVIEHIHERVPILLLPVTWAARAQRLRKQGKSDRWRADIALPCKDSRAADDNAAHLLTRSYAELFAQALDFMVQDAAPMWDGEAQPGAVAMSVNAADQEGMPEQISLFVVGSRQRAPLVAVAQQMLRTMHVPVLVVPEA